MKNKIDGKFYYKEMLKQAKKDFDQAFESKVGHYLLYRLYCILILCFAIREKCGVKYERNSVFSGLKRYYNILKHNYSMDITIQSAVLPNEEYTDNPVFPSIDKFNNNDYKKQTENYNNYIKGKSIKDLIEDLYNCTICKLNSYTE